MADLQQLKAIYAAYEREAREEKQKAPPFAGFLGWGDDPRNAPCHNRFYEAVGEWTEAFLAEDRENDSIFEAVRWLICAPAETAEPEAYWYMYAAQGFARPMLSSLLLQQRTQLKEFFDVHYPRRDRMPVQEEIYKVLSKETGGKKWGLFR